MYTLYFKDCVDWKTVKADNGLKLKINILYVKVIPIVSSIPTCKIVFTCIYIEWN